MTTNEVLLDDNGIKEGDSIVIPETVAVEDAKGSGNVDNHTLHKKLLVAFIAGGLSLFAVNTAVSVVAENLHRTPSTDQVIAGLRSERDDFTKFCKEQNGSLSIDGYARTTCSIVHGDEEFWIPAPVEIRHHPTQYTDWDTDADKHGREGGHYNSERNTHHE